MIHGYCGLEYLCRPTKRIAILHRAKMPPSSPQLAAATATASSEGQRLHRTTPLVAAAAEANATATTTTTSTVAETARSESAAAQAAITTTTSTTTTNNNAHDAASAATSSSPFSYTELLYAVNSFYAIVQPGTFVVSSLDCTLKHSCVRQSLTMWLIDICVYVYVRTLCTVFITMVLSAWAVIFIATPESTAVTTAALEQSYNVVHSSDQDTNARQLGNSLINGLFIVTFICALTFVIVLLYKYKCMTCLIGYMILSSTLLLGFLGTLTRRTNVSLSCLLVPVVSNTFR
jgi:Presenilin